MYRNGAGKLETPDGQPITQPFDGDGYVSSFTFDDSDKVTFKGKFVKTQGYVEEQAAGKALYRGAFSPANVTGDLFYNPFDFTYKNIANTGVVEWNNEVLALWESGMPHALDPKTLDTKGTTRMDNTIDRDGSASAHYKIRDGRLINFGWKLSGISDMHLKIWEYASDSYDVVQYSELKV